MVTLLKNLTVESLTIPSGVILDPTRDYTVTVLPANITNNGTIVVYDLQTAQALMDINGTIKCGTSLGSSAGPVELPSGTTITTQNVAGSSESTYVISVEGVTGATGAVWSGELKP